jgi:hypothetical protein
MALVGKLRIRQHRLLRFLAVLDTGVAFCLFLALMGIRKGLISLFGSASPEVQAAVELLFAFAAGAACYASARGVFFTQETPIAAFVEQEALFGDARALPDSVSRACDLLPSPLTQSVVRLALSSRSGALTQFSSFLGIVVMAVLLFLFSAAASDYAVSLSMFFATTVLVIVASLSLILEAVRPLFDISRPLPLSFPEATRALIEGGAMLSMPVFLVATLFSLTYGIVDGVTVLGGALVISLLMFMLRVFTSLRYPHAETLGQFSFAFSLILALPVLTYPIVLVYQRTRAKHVWTPPHHS